MNIITKPTLIQQPKTVIAVGFHLYTWATEKQLAWKENLNQPW